MTTRIDGRQDDDLLSQKGFRGFPSLAIMDADGEIIKQDLGRSVAAMSAAIDAISEWNSLTQKIKAGAKGLEGKLLLAELQLGKVSPKDAKAKMAKMKLSDEDKKAFDGILLSSEVQAWLKGAQNREMSPKDFFAKVHGAWKAGRRPAKGTEGADMFWQFLLDGAEQAIDPEAFAEAAKKQLERQKKGFDERLEALRERAAKSKKPGK